METKVICPWGIDLDHGGGDVPALAHQTEDRGVVFEHGNVGFNRLILRHGNFPVDIVWSDVFCGATGAVAVSESF